MTNIKNILPPFLNIEVFYGTQYDPTVVRSYYRFFSIGKMII
jgi:hypothetical protein